MGSFAYTCAVSGLPIEAGDPVRYFLLTQNPYRNGAENTCYIHDLWFPRTFPLKGEYNDYGSVDGIADGPEKDIWLEGLKLDMIERGWGNNTVHDVPISKEMTFDKLLDAIQEGRVIVEREYDMHDLSDWREKFLGIKDEPNLSPEEKRDRRIPIGVPTMYRVQKIAEKVGVPLYTGDWGTKSVVIDSPQGNEIRVRCHGSYGVQDPNKPYDATQRINEQLDILNRLKDGLDEYAVLLSSGSDACACYKIPNDRNSGTYILPDCELLIRPKPGTHDGALSKHQTKKAPLSVGHAMIREDIWRVMLDSTVEIWDGKRTSQKGIDAFYDSIKKYVEYLKDEKNSEDFKKWGRLGARMERGENLPGVWLITKEIIPFSVGLSKHFELMMNKAEIPDEFLKTVAEFAFINCLLAQTRYQWRLSASAGPQFGEWKAHERLLKSFAKVASAKVKEQEAERKKWG